MISTRLIPLLLVMCAPVLVGCATLIEGSTQRVSFKTVGAEDAYCDVQIGDSKYTYAVRPPRAIWIQKSADPMFISCTAPGNRTKNMTVESGVAGSAVLNGMTAGATLAVDATSGALYKYPDEVVIDFAGAVAKPITLPSYENAGTYRPKDSEIEYMGPDTPALPGDEAEAARVKKAYAEDAKEKAAQKALEEERARRIEVVEGGFYGDKGDKKATSPDKPDKNVELSPLSDAVPKVPGPHGGDSVGGSSLKGAGTWAQPAAPKLGKPIFPSSTSF